MNNIKDKKIDDFISVDVPRGDWEMICPIEASERIQELENVNQKGSDGFARLHQAARWNNYSAVILAFINKGANMNVRDKYKRTPLHWAAWGNEFLSHNEPKTGRLIAKVLLEAGAKPDAKDIWGIVPFQLAAINNGNEFVLEALINFDGVKEHLLGANGKKVLDLAKEHNGKNYRVIEVLEKAMEKANTPCQ